MAKTFLKSIKKLENKMYNQIIQRIQNMISVNKFAAKYTNLM